MPKQHQTPESSWQEAANFANEIRLTLAKNTCASTHKHVRLNYLLGSDGWYAWLQFCKEHPEHPLVKKFFE